MLKTREVTPMKCPTCGSTDFYVKDEEDEFETYEFSCAGGCVAFDPGYDNPPEVTDDMETYCGKCAWHGKLCDMA